MSLRNARGGELHCYSMQAPPAEDPSLAAQPDEQQSGAERAGTALQEPAGVSQSEAEPVAAPDGGAAHNGSMRGDRKHVRKREEPAGVSNEPLIVPALVPDTCCPLLSVKESRNSFMLWWMSLHKLSTMAKGSLA